MIDLTDLSGHDVVTGGSALATIGAAIRFARQSTLTRSLVARLSRRAIRRSTMDLWIARLEKENPTMKIPPFPPDSEKDDDDIEALARASE